MKRREFIKLFGGAGLSWPLIAHAQEPQTEQDASRLILGAWEFVASIVINADGSKQDLWGPSASGILLFESGGRVAEIIHRPRSGFHLRKSFYFFGSYSFDQSGKIVTLKIDASNSSNIIGAISFFQLLRLTEDELSYRNPMTASGKTLEVTWRRRKHKRS